MKITLQVGDMVAIKGTGHVFRVHALLPNGSIELRVRGRTIATQLWPPDLTSIARDGKVFKITIYHFGPKYNLSRFSDTYWEFEVADVTGDTPLPEDFARLLT